MPAAPRAIDMIRCARIARDRGLAGAIFPPSAYFLQPFLEMTDDQAHEAVKGFIAA